jgi:Stage II sporulation protein E (SpoIIE)
LKSNNHTGDSRRQDQAQEHRVLGLLNFVVFLAIAAVAYTDWIVVANISLGYLYVLPIALSALINPLPLTVALAIGCTVLQDIFGPVAETLQVRLVRGAIGLAGFLIVGFLVTLIAKQRNRLTAEVRRQRDEYEHDLILASQVQRQVLPKPPIMTNLELAAAMETAQLLGGDYYDFYQVSENVVDVVIADVSGHGAAASLLMPSLAVALRLRARELDGPAAILKDLDQVLSQITNPATFVTMFYGRFDQATRTLKYANGGHNPPSSFARKPGNR